MRKTYVLDTNILLAYPNAIYGFADNKVAITMTTLRELDTKKTAPGELGFNARRIICELDILREMAEKNDLTIGTELPSGGRFFVITDNYKCMPDGLSVEVPDNRIIATIIKYAKEHNKEEVALVTNDISMRVIASSAHFTNVQGYLNEHLKSEGNYTGIRKKYVSASKIKEITQASYGCEYDYDKDEMPLVQNEYVWFIDKDNENNKILTRNSFGTVTAIEPGFMRAYGVKPKNDAQAAAINALLAPSDKIPLVILKGPAGSAKTFLSLAAGLENTYGQRGYGKYDKIYITRNNVTSDDDFGYLPGELDEKMGPLLAPFYDNLENLIKNHGEKEKTQIEYAIQDLFDTKVIDLCPMAYMRGRSITNSYLIVDEAQNATRSQIRDIITRAGVGTKIVLLGDPSQIDAHNLDKYSNGLVFAAEKFKNHPLCAQITFNSEECVRSELAKAAIDILV